jgi:hypothetical protein
VTDTGQMLRILIVKSEQVLVIFQHTDMPQTAHPTSSRLIVSDSENALVSARTK